MKTTEIKDMTQAQLVERVQELESQLAKCLGEGREGPPVNVLLEIWPIIANGITCLDGIGDTPRAHEITANELDGWLLDWGLLIETFVWAQNERRESHPGFVMEDSNFTGIFDRLTFMTTMFRRLHSKFWQLQHEAEKEGKN